jgi:hypothetical protein
MNVDVSLSKDFKLREFLISQEAARRGLQIVPSEAEVENLRRLCETLLQPLRNVYGRMQITSGFRPVWLNNLIGGSQSSAHVYGCAADVEFLDHPNEFVWNNINSSNKCHGLVFDQIINEFLPDGWIHFGIPRVGARARGEFRIAHNGPKGPIYELV